MSGSIHDSCRLFGISRQSYYQHQRVNKQKDIQQQIVVDMVREVRRKMPTAGGRLLHKILKDDLSKMNIKLGRDGLFNLLAAENMLIRRRKRRIWTTDSKHGLKIYTNLIRDLEVTRPNQVWVSDITYFRVNQGFVFISLVTDMYSKKIIGYNVADSLQGINALRALKMAIAQASFPLREVIHHSDRGIQYCSKTYVELLKKNQIRISMSAKGNPLENAVAERINGTIKNDFLYHCKIQNLTDARMELKRVVSIYNEERPHSSLEYLPPSTAHQKTNGGLKNLWKVNKSCKPIVGLNNNCKLISGLNKKL